MPWRAAPGGTGPAHAWVLDLQRPGREEAHLCCFSPQDRSSEVKDSTAARHSCLSGALFSPMLLGKLFLDTETTPLAWLTTLVHHSRAQEAHVRRHGARLFPTCWRQSWSRGDFSEGSFLSFFLRLYPDQSTAVPLTGDSSATHRRDKSDLVSLRCRGWYTLAGVRGSRCINVQNL